MKRLLKNILLRLLPFYQWLLVLRCRQVKEIRVCFFAMSLSMWRYQGLYDLMSKHHKFNPFIVICPSRELSMDHQKMEVQELLRYFNSRGISYIVASEDNYVDIRKEIAPDILFYPQPYNNYYPKALSFNSYYDKLLCYFPYAYWETSDEWSYTHPLHNTAWKMFYPNKAHKEDAVKYAFRRGHNMEIVGYPNADEFMSGLYIDRWKPQDNPKKRVIWAPHYTITSAGHFVQSNFLWMSEFMLELARKYRDQIQFAFKPHPRLYTELCMHKEWGVAKTQEYFTQWTRMSNTQVETGEFVDLFMTSDAMIHDSGSFAIEYHYSKNPVMYITDDIDKQLANKNEVGQGALKIHYAGKSKEDIIEFLEQVVIEGEDKMKPMRQAFYEKYLVPPGKRTVAENAMEILVRVFCPNDKSYKK